MVNSGPMRLGGFTLFDVKANVVPTREILLLIECPTIDRYPLRTRDHSNRR